MAGGLFVSLLFGYDHEAAYNLVDEGHAVMDYLFLKDVATAIVPPFGLSG